MPPIPLTNAGNSPGPASVPSSGAAPSVSWQNPIPPLPPAAPGGGQVTVVPMQGLPYGPAVTTIGGPIPLDSCGPAPGPIDIGLPRPESNFHLSADYLLWTVRGGVPTEIRNLITGSGLNPDATLHGLPMDGWQSGLRLFGRYSPGDNSWPTFEIGGFVLASNSGSFDGTITSSPQLNPSLVPSQLFLQPVVGGVIVVPGSRGIADVPIPGPDGQVDLDASDKLISHIVAKSERQLWGLEANVRSSPLYFGAIRWDCLAGFRNVNLRERLTVQGDFTFREPPADGDPDELPGNPEDNHVNSMHTFDSIQVLNNFYGGQVGLSFETRVTQGFTFSGFAKVALGGTTEKVSQFGTTTLDATTIETNAGGPFIPRPAAVLPGGLFTPQVPGGVVRHSSHFSVLPDLNLNFGYQFNNHWQAYFGLDYFYLSNVARIGSTSPILAASNQGHLETYGVDFGMQFRY
jgi:Putative beta barrel porin-7 (BBP7)